MLMFRATGLIIGLCFFAFLTWFNVDTLREHFGSGPPYFSRTWRWTAAPTAWISSGGCYRRHRCDCATAATSC